MTKPTNPPCEAFSIRDLLRQQSSELPQSFAFHRLSSSGICLLASAEGVRHSSRKVQGCLGHCLQHCRQCGERPQCEKGSDQASFPLPADALGHIRMTLHLGDRESTPKHNRRCPSASLRATDRCGCQAGTTQGVSVCQPLAFGQACTGESSHTCQPIAASTTRRQQACGLHPSEEQLTFFDRFLVYQPFYFSAVRFDT
jgi:hypothetical protein